MPAIAYSTDHANLNLDKVAEKDKTRAQPGEYSEEIGRYNGWYEESKELRRTHDLRWAKNIQLLRGIFPADELTRSKVRKRSKIFFRKIWASNLRILAAMHDAFLREADQFQIVARNGDPDDEDKAEILQIMVEYRRDVMLREESLFLQLVWSIMTILDLGWACGKLGWKYKKKDGKAIIDRPDYNLYPNEQVYPDLSATLPHKMRFLIFENYLTVEDMEDEGYSVEGCDAYSSPDNPVRNARFVDRQRDPINFADTNTNQTYPKPGSTGEEKTSPIAARYCVREVLYQEDDTIKIAAY